MITKLFPTQFMLYMVLQGLYCTRVACMAYPNAEVGHVLLVQVVQGMQHLLHTHSTQGLCQVVLQHKVLQDVRPCHPATQNIKMAA